MATYYVKNSGSDLADGLSDTNAWATIAKVEGESFSPGDSIWFKRGDTWTEGFTFADNGSAGNYITIGAYGTGAKPIIDGGYTLPGGSVYYFLVQIDGDYVKFQDFSVRRSSGSLIILNSGASYSELLRIDGNGSRETGMVAAGTGNVISGCTMTDNGNGYGIDGQTTWGSAICTVGVNTVIQSCVSYENKGEGLNAYSTSTNATIQDCISYNNQAYNLYLDSSNGGLVQRNIVYETNHDYGQYGITIGAETGTASDLLICNNFVLGCWTNFHVDSNVATLDNIDVIYNTFVNSTGIVGDGYNMGVYYRSDISSYVDSVFMNNIVIEEDGARVPISVESSHDGLTFSYNCWSKAAIAAAQGTGDVTGDPLLNKTGPTTPGDLTGVYFQIPSGSIAVGVANPTVDVTEDFYGTTRGATADIGGYEYMAAGTSYYIDATLGSDSNLGTSDLTPWQTLAKASSASLTAGDNVYLKCGETWYEPLVITNKDGTAGAYITIGQYGSGADPIIDGSESATGWGLVTGAVYSKLFTYTPGMVLEDGVVLDNLLTWDTDAATTFSGASAPAWSRSGTTAYVLATDSLDPDTHTMRVAAKTGNDRYGIYIIGCNYLTVQDIKIQHTTQNGVLIQGNAVSGGCTYVTVKRCTLHGTGSDALTASTNQAGYNHNNHITFGGADGDGNTITYPGQKGAGFFYGTSDSVISYNTISYTGWRGTTSSDGGHGISSWSNDATRNPRNNIIEHNIVHHVNKTNAGSEGTGIHADNHTRDCTYRYNISYSNQGSGFYDNGDGGGNKFYHNIAYGNGTEVTSGYQGGMTFADLSTVYIYNNIVYGNFNCGLGFYSTISTEAIIKNNILSQNGTNGVEKEIAISVPAAANITSDYNCIYHTATADFMLWSGSAKTWATWLSSSGQDAHSINTDPLMTDPGSADFTPTSSTPCFDAGVDVGLTADFIGTAIPQSTGFDIGAYEYIPVEDIGTWVVCDDVSTGENIFPNGRFTTNTAGWNATNASTLSSESGGQSGNCLQILCDGTSNPGAQEVWVSGITAGDKYKFRYYVKAGTEASYRVYVRDVTHGNAALYDSTTLEATGSWVAFTTPEITIPAGTTSIDVLLRQVASASAATTDFFDELCMYRNTVFKATYAPEVATLKEDGVSLTKLTWDTDVPTTFEGAAAGSWVQNAGVVYCYCTDGLDPDTHTMTALGAKPTTYYIGSDVGDDYASWTAYNAAHTDIAGDVISLRRGDTFTEMITMPTDGTLANPIRIVAHGTGANPIIDAEDTRAYCINGNGKDYIQIENIDFDGGTTANVLLDGDNCTLTGSTSVGGVIGVSITGASAVVDDITIGTSTGTALNAGGASGVYTRIVIDQAGANGILCSGASNSISRSEIAGCTAEAVDVTGNDNVIFYNKINGNVEYGLIVTGTGLEFYNNIIFNSGGGINADESCTAQNNIVQTVDADNINILATKTVTGGYNCFDDAAKAGDGTYTDVGASTLWEEDALMVDPANGDFTLQALSPCIDAGVDVGLTADFVGATVPYPDTAPDIGAYETTPTPTEGSATATHMSLDISLELK